MFREEVSCKEREREKGAMKTAERTVGCGEGEEDGGGVPPDELRVREGQVPALAERRATGGNNNVRFPLPSELPAD